MKLIRLSELPDKGVSHNARIRKRVLLEPGEIGAMTQYARAVFPPGECAPAHRHDDMCEVFTAVSGCGEIRIDDVAYVLSAGTTVRVDANEEHEIVNTGEIPLVVIYFGVLLA